MAYYNSYLQYTGQPQQQQQQQQPVQQYSFAPAPGYAYSGYSSGCYSQTVGPSLANGFGGASSSYKVNLPQYIAGPSYSTTSDNDFNFGSGGLPVAGYGNPNSCGYTSYTGYSTQQQQPQYSSQYQPMPSQQPPEISQYYQPYQCSVNAQHQQLQSHSHHTNRSQSQHSMSQPQSQAHSFSQTHMLDENNNNAAMTQTQQTDTCTESHHQHQQQQCNSLQPQIDAACEAAAAGTHHRRQPVIKRQVITVPGTPGRIQQVVRRLPTPTPDIVERVFVVKPQRDVINLVIERPGTPPAQYKDRTVMGKQRRPLIHPRIVRVPAASQRNTPFLQLLQYQQPYVHALPAAYTTTTAATPTQQQQQQQHQQHIRSCCVSAHAYSQQPESSQPALSQQSQGQLSSNELSQASESQLSCQQQQQQYQPQLQLGQQPSQMMQQQQPKGYLVAPVAYDSEAAATGVAYMPALTCQSGFMQAAEGTGYTYNTTAYMTQPQNYYYGYQSAAAAAQPVARYY